MQPKKGLNKANKICFKITTYIPENFGAKKLGSNAFVTGPGRYTRIEEKHWKDSVQYPGCNSDALKRYNQKASSIKFDEYFIVAY